MIKQNKNHGIGNELIKVSSQEISINKKRMVCTIDNLNNKNIFTLNG